MPCARCLGRRDLVLYRRGMACRCWVARWLHAKHRASSMYLPSRRTGYASEECCENARRSIERRRVRSASRTLPRIDGTHCVRRRARSRPLLSVGDWHPAGRDVASQPVPRRTHPFSLRRSINTAAAQLHRARLLPCVLSTQARVSLRRCSMTWAPPSTHRLGVTACQERRAEARSQTVFHTVRYQLRLFQRSTWTATP